MRVMQVMAGAEVGGAEAFFERLVLALARAGLDQRVVIRRHAERAKALRAVGLDPVELRFGGRLDVVTPLRLRKEAAAFKPDVVLTWMNRATRMMPPGPYVLAARLGGYYDLKHYRRCDELVANTRDIVDYLVGRGWPPERATYLPNFADDAALPPVPRANLATPDDAPVILGLGRLHPNKGFDVLIDALADLPGAVLWLAGEGPLRGELETQARRMGVFERVRFLGWRTDVPALLAACDVFVCSSRHEPLGNVVLEAWARGRPVVASASSGPAQLIRHGETGLLAPVGDAQGLARAVASLLADSERAARLGAAGRQAFEAEFTEAAVVRRYLDFFERVAARKRGR